jgi:hypothetical protein
VKLEIQQYIYTPYKLLRLSDYTKPNQIFLIDDEQVSLEVFQQTLNSLIKIGVLKFV